MMHMSPQDADRAVANVLGALALGVSDRLTATSDASALVTLLERGQLTIEWLRRIIGLSHSASVRLVDRLAAEQLVQRHAGPDRRSVSIQLTTRGRRIATGLRSERETQLIELIDPLTRDERATLSTIAEKLAMSLVTGCWEARFVCRLCDHGACASAGGCPVDRAASLVGQ
jgi:MarR family transcriptional regulator, negative regulator of the multidrug operon emrRAB